MSTTAEDDLLLERQLCFALTVASRSVVGIYKPVLERMGLTHPQYLVMLALWERSPRTLKDISDALLHEPATLSPILRRLEEAGLLTRQRVPGNERALAVTLTKAGAALREQATAVPGRPLPTTAEPGRLPQANAQQSRTTQGKTQGPERKPRSFSV